MDNKYDPINLFLQAYKYGNRFGNEESADTTRKSGKEKSTDTTRKKDKEKSTDKIESVDFFWHVTARKQWSRSERRERIKNFNTKQTIKQTSNTIYTNKSWNNSCILKNEIRQILYLVSA